MTDLGLAARGVDLVPEFIESARSHRSGVEFTVGSLHALDIPDHALGGILAWYSLIHCGPSELAEALTEFRRTISRGGKLVAGFFDGDEIGHFDHKVTTAYRWIRLPRSAQHVNQCARATR